MEYVYAAMLLHSAGKGIDDKAVSSVLKAAGVEADGARVTALVASLNEVDIDEAMATAVAVASAAPSASSGGAPSEAAPAEDEAAEEPEEDAGGFEGLGSLFG